MDSKNPDSVAPSPRIELEQVSRRPGAESGEWAVTWSIRNLTTDPLALESAWLPHGQFRGARTEIHPLQTPEPGEVARIELSVRCNEPAGSVVENAFLILTMRWRNDPWRILTRLTVRIGDDGAPHAVTETMTVQPVGFSAHTN